MNTVRKGSRGREIRFLQIVLNTHSQRQPKLKVDATFGDKTESAVRDFQKYAGLVADGIVGAGTWRALLAPAKIPAPNLRKFRSQVGTAADFVDHLRRLEQTHRDATRLLAAVSDFTATSGGARYLLTTRSPQIIDFRHFFAAASEAYSGTLSKKAGAPLGGTRGDALLLGVANELAQCLGEGIKSKLNSCFSGEDLGSNRLGAEFGRSVAIARAEARPTPVHQQLQAFLVRIAPQPPKAIGAAQLPGAGNTALESVGAIVIGILDILVPDAY